MINDSSPLLECRGIDKSFKDGTRSLQVFSGLRLEIKPQEKVVIVGRSGSGKTTLLHLIAGIDRFDSGQILFQGHDIVRLSRARLNTYRLKCIGLVFQFHFLLPDFSAEENIAMPCLIAGLSKKAARVRARQALEQVGLADRAGHLPSALSGGERQRVAVLRAIANRPALIIADEPTGNLDEKTAASIIDLLFDQSRESHSALLIATHDPALADRSDHSYELKSNGLQPL